MRYKIPVKKKKEEEEELAHANTINTRQTSVEITRINCILMQNNGNVSPTSNEIINVKHKWNTTQVYQSDLFERLNDQVELEKLITKSKTTLIVWNSIIWQEEEMIIKFEMVVSNAMLGTLSVLG